MAAQTLEGLRIEQVGATYPENDEVSISNMDLDNWVFAETKQYRFEASYVDGGADITYAKTRFTDGYNTITVSYNGVTDIVSLENGTDTVQLSNGIGVWNGGLLTVTFQLYFSSNILKIHYPLYCLFPTIWDSPQIFMNLWSVLKEAC